MSLTQLYQSFLTAPSEGVLAENATLNYITTVTTVQGVAPILKHFNSQQKVLRKKEERFLSTVEDQHSLCVEVQTSLEFITGGGSYLPGLDDNFVSDRKAIFPIVSPNSASSVWRKLTPLDPHRSLR